MAFVGSGLTLLLIVLLPIQTGVAIGIFLSLAHGVFSITRTRLIPFEPVAGTTVWWPAAHAAFRVEDGVLVVGFQAPLSFLNAYTFRRDMQQALAACRRAQLLVLEASSIVEIDFTAAQILKEVIEMARCADVAFALARLESVRALAALQRFGVFEALGEGHIFRSVHEAIVAIGRGKTGSDPAAEATAP